MTVHVNEDASLLPAGQAGARGITAKQMLTWQELRHIKNSKGEGHESHPRVAYFGPKYLA